MAYNDETLDIVIMKFEDLSGKYKLTNIEKKIKELIEEKRSNVMLFLTDHNKACAL